ncbi:ABC transporter permease [Streptomyces sp. NPDC002346]
MRAVSPRASAAGNRRGTWWRHGLISAAVLVGAGIGWQLLSYAFAGDTKGSASPLVPGWGWLITKALPAMANYGGDGMGLTAGQGGTNGSYGGAFSVLVSASAITWGRLLIGLIGGALVGFVLAVAVSSSKWLARFLEVLANMLRMLPALALIPLFQLWFGISFKGVVIFMVYTNGVVFFVGMLNAIRNVPAIYLHNAKALGAGKLRTYATVVLPATLPELRSTVFFSLGWSWSAVVGAEFLGVQSGLGYIEAQANQFALLDRMFVVALLFLLLASVSFLVFNLVCRPLLAWAPGGGRG